MVVLQDDISIILNILIPKYQFLIFWEIVPELILSPCSFQSLPHNVKNVSMKTFVMSSLFFSLLSEKCETCSLNHELRFLWCMLIQQYLHLYETIETIITLLVLIKGTESDIFKLI
jgi:hypothetical protein